MPPTLTPAAIAALAAPGEAFLKEKEQEEAVYKLPSGLLFRILKKGHGTECPLASTSCQIHYHGTLADGSVFDSSVQRNKPATFAPLQVIKGWTEALQLMREGDKWEVFLPHGLAYGQKGSPPKIPPFTPLVFTIEILQIHGKAQPAAKADAVLVAALGHPYAELRDMETIAREREEAEEEARLMAQYEC